MSEKLTAQALVFTKNPKRQEAYWTYKAPPTPTYEEVPAGAFKGTKSQWESLSPGMRREIVRSYNKNPKQRKRAGTRRRAAKRAAPRRRKIKRSSTRTSRTPARIIRAMGENRRHDWAVGYWNGKGLVGQKSKAKRYSGDADTQRAFNSARRFIARSDSGKKIRWRALEAVPA